MSVERVEATCPRCFRLYRIVLDPEQLGAMGKSAVCGRCGERFDVLARLRERTDVRPPDPPPVASEPVAKAPSPPPPPPRRRRKPRYTLPMTAVKQVSIAPPLPSPAVVEAQLPESTRFTPAGAWAAPDAPRSPPPPPRGVEIARVARRRVVAAGSAPPAEDIPLPPSPAPTPMQTPTLVPAGHMTPAAAPAVTHYEAPTDAPRFVVDAPVELASSSWAEMVTTSLDALCEEEPMAHHAIARILDDS